MVERSPEKAGVGGSTPSLATTLHYIQRDVFGNSKASSSRFAVLSWIQFLLIHAYPLSSGICGDEFK